MEKKQKTIVTAEILENQGLKPILKWAGGKRWLLPVIKEYWVPYANTKTPTTLVEPFAGGLAIAFGLNPEKAILNDANMHLINFYHQVKNGLSLTPRFQNTLEYYTNQKAKFNRLIQKGEYQTKAAAALFYYLNRTGFNGLCRFNQSGIFNVPFGRHHTINYPKDFLEYQSILRKWEFLNTDFENVSLKGDEFIYADPPYDVEFRQYQPKGFSFEDQIRLANWLSKHKGPVIASNQATDRILDLYKNLGFKITLVSAPRLISCNGNRQRAEEMLAFKSLGAKL